MADRTLIEWADATWNPVTGCTPVSEGCANCYAARMARRFPQLHRPELPCCDEFSHVHFHRDRLEAPLRWRKPRRVFVCSMGDLFHEQVVYDTIRAVLHVIEKCPQHTFMLLTKRPEIAIGYKLDLPNLWLGVTAENQEQADGRIPQLLKVPAALHFVSVEPMLGPVDISYYLNGCPEQDSYGEWYQIFMPIGWVICGAETGPGARRMSPAWALALKEQCDAAGIPFFLKKWGTNQDPISAGWREFPKGDR